MKSSVSQRLLMPFLERTATFLQSKRHLSMPMFGMIWAESPVTSNTVNGGTVATHWASIWNDRNIIIPQTILYRSTTNFDAWLCPNLSLLIWSNQRHIMVTSELCWFYHMTPFPSYKRFLMPVQQTAFWKRSDKKRNCSKQAISPFASVFNF